ncbi:MAG: histidine phosphatase family protein [Candidatus Dormibacteraeota bacterium]|nr:histidine phosphatase family protein [Candidatus Dormibacteraeota bacterium]
MSAAEAKALTSAVRSIEGAFLIGVPGTTELWLVRHGDCYEGMTAEADPPLSPTGQVQAARLAARLRRLELAAVYSSPLRRALETARAITPNVHVEERLREVEIKLSAGRVEVTEAPDQVLRRVTSALDEMVAAHPGGRVIVVAHALSILAYLCGVLRVEAGSLRLLPYYTSISVVRALGDRRMAGSVADVAHLEA